MSKYEKLWDLIKKASPEQKEQIINQLTEEDLMALRQCANPYGKPVYKSASKLLDLSFMNMEQEYMQNFMMTSLVGFIYKMAAEYDFSNSQYTTENQKCVCGRMQQEHTVFEQVQKNDKSEKSEICTKFTAKYLSEDDPVFATKLNDALKMLAIDNLENHYAAVYEKSGKPEDCARMLRAVVIAARKRDSFSDLSEKSENSQERDLSEKSEKNSGADCLEQEAREYCKKHNVNFDSVFPTEVTLEAEQIEQAKQSVKTQLNCKKTLQDKIRERQDQVLDFLDYYLKYDPNNHIRCGYMPNYDKILQQKIKDNKHNFKTVSGMIVDSNFEEYLIPPADTHFSLKNYIDSNYEHLRQCTDDIYGKKCAFECAILPLETFNSEEKAAEFEKKYGSELDCSVHRVQFNNWTFLDSWKENRDKLTFNDDKAELIKQIIAQRQKDEQMGKALLNKKKNKMKGRVQNKDDKPLGFGSDIQDPKYNISEDDFKNKDYNDKTDIELKVFQTKVLRTKRFRTQLNQGSMSLKSDKPVSNVIN